MKETKKYCPYCGSEDIVMCKLPPNVLVDPAPTVVDMVKDLFHKNYKCQKCGKEFD